LLRISGLLLDLRRAVLERQSNYDWQCYFSHSRNDESSTRNYKFMSDMLEVTNENIRNLVILAKEGEMVDPIDWGDLKITEEQAYVMMAAHVLEMERNHLTDGAIIVKLLVENFVLNLKLMGKK
jgi:hypothetical protein